MMTRAAMSLVGIVTGLLVGGCSTHIRVGFDPASLAAAPRREAAPVADKALLVMAAEDAGWVYEVRSAYVRENYLKLSFEVGEITKQAALQVLGAAYTQGVEYRNEAGNARGFAVIVTPKVDKFTFGWKQVVQVERLVLALIPFMGYSPQVQPWIEMEMHVEFRAPDGRLLFETTCQSARQFGNQCESSSEMTRGKRGAGELRRLFHLTAVRLLETAVAEFEKRSRP